MHMLALVLRLCFGVATMLWCCHHAYMFCSACFGVATMLACSNVIACFSAANNTSILWLGILHLQWWCSSRVYLKNESCSTWEGSQIRVLRVSKAHHGGGLQEVASAAHVAAAAAEVVAPHQLDVADHVAAAAAAKVAPAPSADSCSCPGPCNQHLLNGPPT